MFFYFYFHYYPLNKIVGGAKGLQTIKNIVESKKKKKNVATICVYRMCWEVANISEMFIGLNHDFEAFSLIGV